MQGTSQVEEVGGALSEVYKLLSWHDPRYCRKRSLEEKFRGQRSMLTIVSGRILLTSQ